MSITGDFAGLSKLIGQLASAGSLVPELRAPFSEAAIGRVRTDTAAGRSPDGAPFAPLRSPRTGTPLGAWAKHVDVRVTGDGFAIGSGHVGAFAHQYGAVIFPRRAAMLRFTVLGQVVFAHKVTIPARPYLPTGEIPAGWATAFEAIATPRFDGHFA